MNLRRVLIACLLLLFAMGHLCCHNDQKIVDKHEQALEEEEA
jgi:hypothetical protein